MAKISLVALCLAMSVYTVCAGKPKSTSDNVTFWCYTKRTPQGVQVTTYDENGYKKCGYDATKPTKIMIHGLAGSQNGKCAQTIKEAYINHTNFNVILVDYAPLSKDYFPLVKNGPCIAKEIVPAIWYLINQMKTSKNDIHVIGHSVGAHIASHVCSSIPGMPRLTGLDPAGPEYRKKPTSEKIDPSDAKYVDVIHTTVLLGYSQPCGHNDYYPHGGKEQPRCAGNDKFGGCSHNSVCEYWAESVANPGRFRADRAPSFDVAQNRKCARTNTGRMGEGSVGDPPGQYCVNV